MPTILRVNVLGGLKPWRNKANKFARKIRCENSLRHFPRIRRTKLKKSPCSGPKPKPKTKTTFPGTKPTFSLGANRNKDTNTKYENHGFGFGHEEGKGHFHTL